MKKPTGPSMDSKLTLEELVRMDHQTLQRLRARIQRMTGVWANEPTHYLCMVINNLESLLPKPQAQPEEPEPTLEPVQEEPESCINYRYIMHAYLITYTTYLGIHSSVLTNRHPAEWAKAHEDSVLLGFQLLSYSDAEKFLRLNSIPQDMIDRRGT